jgi:hypothetical protein
MSATTSTPRKRASRRGRWYAGIMLVLLLLATVVGGTSARAADGELHHAGLIIRHGDGQQTYAYVTFPEDEISGLELLERTGIEQVTVSFGGLGAGVCSLEGEGCPTGQCRRNVCQSGANAPYWRYFRQVEPGTWEPAPLGASSTRVSNGTVDAWVWTSGEAELPAVTLADVRELAGADDTAARKSETIPTASVRSTYSPGSDDDPPASALTLVIAAALILLVGLGGIFAVRRSRRGALR